MSSSEERLHTGRLAKERNCFVISEIEGQPMKGSPEVGQQLQFAARLESWAKGMDYCAVAVPANVTHALKTKGPVSVMAQVNESAPFRVSLFPVGGGKHYIRIKAKVRRETRTKVGDEVEMRFTVLDRGSITIPEALLSALQANGATEAFKSLPAGKQNFLIRRLEEAVKPETRGKRIFDVVAAAHEQKNKSAE